jgi:hypothetical protein
MTNEQNRQEIAVAQEANASELDTAAGAFKFMWKDENGQAMVEFVMMVSVMVVMGILINLVFGELIEGRMRLTWEHIIYPCFLF